MSLRRILSTLLLSSVALVATPTAGNAAATWTKASTTVSIACSSSSTLSQAANWYFPSTATPKALVYLQHGFSRSNANMEALAGKYADAGFLVFVPTLPSSTASNNCAVNNTGDNTTFLNNVAALIGEATVATSSLARSYTTAAGLAGRTGQAMPATYVIAGHSAGGDAVSYIANRLRTTWPAAFANLKLVQLLDPVLSPKGTNMATGLAGLATTSTPIYAISSPPYTANDQASGTTELLKDVDRPFLGCG
ncbi:alpha/beta hydrolase [Paractinoplanes durhamensis]|uniref:alpha/beta hydrolase n=1 Tax=Paractinoplanes durhamensis TaxID=113563 RepID=UPI003635AAED